MAAIVVTNVYKINQRPAIPLAEVSLVGLPSAGTVLIDTTDSPTRDLGNGITVYTGVKVTNGDVYYVQQTITSMASLLNA